MPWTTACSPCRMTFPGADTSRTSDNMAPGSPEKEREREDGRSLDLREPLIQAPHYNKKGSYHSALAVCPKSSAGQQSACCCCEVASVVSDSVRPHRRQPTRLPRPWDSPGMEYYSAIKENETLPSAAKWRGLQTAALREVN